MNRQEFEARYELIAQVTDGVFESHHALHHTGVVVMAHFVTGSEDLRGAVQAAAEALRADEADDQVLESHRIDERLVIVTRFLKDFASFDEWLASRGYPLGTAGAASHDSASSGGGDEASQGPGEFTRMFMAGQGLGNRPAPEPPAEPPSDPEGAGSGPGEFTQMFRAVPPKSEPSPAAPEKGAATREPDRVEPAAARRDTTQDPSPAAGPSDADAGPGSDEPGEFTRMFRAVEGKSPDTTAPDVRTDKPTESTPPVSADPSPPPTPADRFAPPPKEETGEFTRFFRPAEEAEGLQRADGPSLDWSDAPMAGRGRAPDAPSPPPKQADDDWAKALRTERPATPPGSASTPSPPNPPVDPPARDRGEFTQIFGAEVPPVPGSSGGPPSEAGTPSPGKGTPSASQSGPSPSGSSGGGFKGPKIPKARIPDAEALIQKGRMRRGKPPRFRPPRGRRLARMGAGAALGAAQAALSGGGSASEQEGAEPSEGGVSSSTFRIGLAVIVIVTVALIAFFALWEFGGAPADEAPVADSVVATPAGPEG